MAVYEETPVRHEDHFIERDSGSSGAAWAVFAVIVILLLVLLFRFNIFGRSSNNSGSTINGTVNTPSGTYQGSGTVQSQ